MRDVLVLCYHAVSEDWPAVLAVPPDRFERQIRSLLERGYRGATFTEAVTGQPAGKTLAVTFDDAYRSVAKLAHPILRELGVPATVFVPTAFPGNDQSMAWPGISRWLGGPHERELAPASWPELEKLVGDGWEIGSHTRSHPRLTQLDDAPLHDELEGSRADCESKLGVECRSIAYPYADCDLRVAAAAKATGYVAGCALSGRIERRNRFLWPRVGVYHDDRDWRFELKVSQIARRARLGATYEVLRRLKRGPGKA